MTSPSPEGKVLPVNFQVVTQSIKQSPKPQQSISASPVGDRLARHRYPQILPKPPATSAITLRSPPTLLITNSPIKTVMPQPHVSSVNVVKMTAISLAPSGGGATLRPGVTVTPIPEDPHQIRCPTPLTPRSPVVRPGAPVPALGPALTLAVSEVAGDAGFSAGGRTDERVAKFRAASEPSFFVKFSPIPDKVARTKSDSQSPPAPIAVAGPQESNNTNCLDGTLYLTVDKQNANGSVPPNGSSAVPPSQKEPASDAKGTRKRSSSGVDAHVIPVKRVFISQQPLAFIDNPKPGVSGRSAVKRIPRAAGGAAGRPESAPCKVTVKQTSTGAPVQVLALSDSPITHAEGSRTLVKPQALLLVKHEGRAICSDSSTAAAPGNNNNSSAADQALLRQIAAADPHLIPANSGGAHEASVLGDLKSTMWEEGQLEELQKQAFAPRIPAEHGQAAVEQLAMIGQAGEPSGQLALSQEMVDFSGGGGQPSMDYFPFNDDDMTQDSIVEELVQMEEQMKLKGLQPLFSNCVDMSLQGPSAGTPASVLSGHQTSSGNAFFAHSAHSSTTPAHTPTPTPTPTPTATPTSDMTLGMSGGMTRESPCSRMAVVTPVDGAMGRHTPIGTPLSNCSSSVPPSPVECRNPFAFTPINSSMTGYHDASVVSSSPVKPMQRPMATHPDKAKLDWINNRYNSSSGGGGGGPLASQSISIGPSYQDLVDDQFRKPHAFAIPGQAFQAQSRQDAHFGRLTPISPVQQQQQVPNVTTTPTKQESFAVPAPMDNKTTASSGSSTFRCRSVSPAVRQRNSSGNTAGAPACTVTATATATTRAVISPFNAAITSEMLSILSNSQAAGAVHSLVQRSQSVPLSIMMQSERLPVQGQSNSTKITSVLLSKMDSEGDDAVRGLGINNLPSNYTARMNLTQILETTAPAFTATHQAQLPVSSSPAAFELQHGYLAGGPAEPAGFPSDEAQAQPGPGEPDQQQRLEAAVHTQAQFLIRSAQQQDVAAAAAAAAEEEQQQLDFNNTVKDLLGDDGLNPSSQLVGQVASELNAVASDFSSDIRLTSDLSSSITDLNTLDTNLLFDPNQPQEQYEDSTLEELKNDPLFQQICSDPGVNSGFDWLESKDQPTTVEMLG